MQVYLARWHHIDVAVKILMNTALDICNEDAVAQTVTLSNPVLLNLQKVGHQISKLRHKSKLDAVLP
jgi:hypothetical protein